MITKDWHENWEDVNSDECVTVVSIIAMNKSEKITGIRLSEYLFLGGFAAIISRGSRIPTL
jgi:hypothetical protein